MNDGLNDAKDSGFEFLTVVKVLDAKNHYSGNRSAQTIESVPIYISVHCLFRDLWIHIHSGTDSLFPVHSYYL